MALALMVGFVPAFLIPIAAYRGALSRGSWFALSLALFMLLVFIPLVDTSMTAAIGLFFLMSEGEFPTSLVFILGGYFIVVGCALGCLLGGLVYPAKKTE